jgi:SAM-dependent methyltransferase
MDLNLVERLTDGLFSKTLQVRRMLRRDSTGLMANPLAEIVALAGRAQELLTEEELQRGVEAIQDQRWHRPTVELDLDQGYAKWADEYDGEPNPLIVLEEPVVLDLVGDVNDRDILDAACGTGRYAIRFAESGARVCGVDASEQMLEVARSKAAGTSLAVDFFTADLNQLPLSNESFDLAVCALALCHLPDLRPAIAELGRVLRPGGRLIISDFHPFCLLIGWRTAMHRPEATYWIENHLNLTQDYLRAVHDCGLRLTDLREAVVDETIAPIIGDDGVELYRGWPVALVLTATKGE